MGVKTRLGKLEAAVERLEELIAESRAADYPYAELQQLGCVLQIVSTHFEPASTTYLASVGRALGDSECLGEDLRAALDILLRDAQSWPLWSKIGDVVGGDIQVPERFIEKEETTKGKEWAWFTDPDDLHGPYASRTAALSGARYTNGSSVLTIDTIRRARASDWVDAESLVESAIERAMDSEFAHYDGIDKYLFTLKDGGQAALEKWAEEWVEDDGTWVTCGDNSEEGTWAELEEG